MTSFSGEPNRSRSQQILILGHDHWNHAGYDQNARRVFQRSLLCNTPALGSRLYTSENEQREFCNTCKAGMACTSCGHWMTMQWQRDREWALPDCPYLSVTFTMPNTLWPVFESNPWLCRKLPEVAAAVLINYARVRKGAEIGVMPILQTFNGRLEFNPHVHALITAGDPQTADANSQSIFFEHSEITRRWQRLITKLLRTALAGGRLKSSMSSYDIERLLHREEHRTWSMTHVQAEIKDHFLSYGGRYLRRPPFSERHIISVANGFVSLWYRDKRTKRRETVRYKVEEFIDRWAQHIPERYRHTVRYFGLFAPRRWARIGTPLFNILGTLRQARSTRLRWAASVEQLTGKNPRIDKNGQWLRFSKHITPSHPGRNRETKRQDDLL